MNTNLTSVKCDANQTKLSTKWYFQAGHCEAFTRPAVVPDLNNNFSEIDISDPLMGYETNWRNFKTVDVEKSNCAWYLKSLEISGEMLNCDHLFIVFERVYFFYSVWINGHCLGECFHGYFPCEFDLKPYLTEGSNMLSVYVGDASTLSGYPTGAISRMERGIWGKVYLQKVQTASISDIYIRTSVKDMRLELDVEIKRYANREILLTAIVSKNGRRIELDIAETALKDSGGIRKYSFSAPWKNPELWEPDNPSLYDLTIELRNNDGILLDSRVTHFGFREFGAAGPDFLLNGEKIGLRNVFSQISHWEEVIRGLGKTVRGIMLELKKHNINCIRFVGQPYPSEWIDCADEVGMMLIVETGLYHSPVSENCFEHFRRLIIHNRNHPSIIFWSSSNEFEHWKVPRDAQTTEFLIKMQKLAHKLDPTRLVQNSGYGGLGGHEDIINIHYPLPHHNFINLPEAFNWVNTDYCPNRLNSGINWQHDRPLAFGEQMLFEPTDRFAAIAGDSLYTEFTGYKSTTVGQAMAQAQRWNLEQSRLNGVAMISTIFSKFLESPYRNYLVDSWKPLGCFFPNRCTQLWADQKYDRELVFYNDDNKPVKGSLHYRFGNEAEQVMPLELSPGSCTSEKVSIQVPQIEKRTEINLLIKLVSNTDKTLLEKEIKFSCFPRKKDSKPVSAALYTYSKSLDSDFKSLESLKKFDRDKLFANGVLVVAGDIPDAELAENASLLQDYTAKGNTVIILPATNGKIRNYSSFLPFEVKLMERPLTISFKAPEVECFEELENEDLRFWGAEQRISEFCFIKPTTGNYRALADAGSIAGLNLSPLLEINSGKGQYVLTSYLFSERISEVPAAGKLLRNLCSFYAGKSFSPVDEFVPAAIICESTESVFCEAMEKLQIEGSHIFRNNIDIKRLMEYEIWIFENSSLLAAINYEKVHELLDSGLTVICNSVNHKKCDLLSELQKSSKEIKFPLQKTGNKLTSQMRLYDLRWINQDSIRESWSFGEDAEQGFSTPGILEAKAYGKGKIIINNVSWEYEKTKPLAATTYFVRLLNQQGVKMLNSIPPESTEAGYSILDISRNCNRNMAAFAQKWIEFQDTKVLNEERTLSPAEAKTMPELAYGCKLKSGKIPQEIIDPRKNHGQNAVVPFDKSAPGADLKPPLEMDNISGAVIDIPQEQSHISRIYFLHTAAVNWHFKQKGKSIIGYYQVNYYCGRKEKIPIIMEYNIGKFKVFADTGLADAKLTACYPGPNSNGMCFYTSYWINKMPQEKIMNIEFLPGENMRILPILLAITIKESNIKYI